MKTNPTPSISRQQLALEVQRLYPKMWSYVIWRVKNRSDTEEILSTVCAKLLAVEEAKAVGLPKYFAWAVVRNTTTDFLRHNRASPIVYMESPEDCETPDEETSCEAIESKDSELKLLRAAIATLPLMMRQAVMWRKVYGYSQKETAIKMGVTENTVEQHLTKAARKLADYIYAKPLQVPDSKADLVSE